MWRILVLGFVVLLACQPAPEKGSEKKASAPAEDRSLEPYVQQANEAIRALQTGLVKALTSALEEGGPEGAVFVCRDEAQKITALVSEKTEITVGRTSHRLRNANNEAPDWAGSIVQEAAGRKTREVEAHVLDLGDRVGVLKPINTLGLCTNCHGSAEEIAPEVKKALAEAYPTDQAVRFSVGDLRGWMWSEVTKQ